MPGLVGRQNRRLAGRSDFRDLSNVLDGYDKTAFIDNHNVTELANEIIARRIVDGLTDTIESIHAPNPEHSY